MTGIRHDAWANAHRIPTAETKPAAEMGRYLNPAELGQPVALGVGYADPAARQASRAPAQP